MFGHLEISVNSHLKSSMGCFVRTVSHRHLLLPKGNAMHLSTEGLGAGPTSIPGGSPGERTSEASWCYQGSSLLCQEMSLHRKATVESWPSFLKYCGTSMSAKECSENGVSFAISE